MYREKVMSWLEGLAEPDWRVFHSDSEVQNIAKSALELLKEQEAIEPDSEHHLFVCPVCRSVLRRNQKFCHECGKRIKWERW